MSSPPILRVTYVTDRAIACLLVDRKRRLVKRTQEERTRLRGDRSVRNRCGDSCARRARDGMKRLARRSRQLRAEGRDNRWSGKPACAHAARRCAPRCGHHCGRCGLSSPARSPSRPPSDGSAYRSRSSVAPPLRDSSAASDSSAIRSQHRPVARPVKPRTGVGFARRRNIAVPNDFRDRIARHQCPCERRKAPVLRRSERHRLIAFNLDSDREIVAARSSPPDRFTGMPGSLRARYELDYGTVAAHQEMRGCLQMRDRREKWVRPGVKTVGEEFFDGLPAEPARRQADVMHDKELDAAGGRTLVAVGRRNVARAFENALVTELWSHAFAVLRKLLAEPRARAATSTLG